MKKDNSKFLAIAGCAAAVLGLTAWAVIERKNSALSDAEVVAIPATAAVTAPKAEGAPLFTAAAPAKTPTSDAKKRLPPVIEDFSVESVEINPKFTVRLSDVAPAAADRKPVDAARSVEVSMDAGENYESAKKLEESAKGVPAKLERARALYQKALESGRLPVPLETNCLARLNDLTAKLVLDPKAICTEPKAEFHKVESGEVVEKIAKKFKVNQGQIKRVNHLNDKLSVRVGQTLKLLQGETVFKVDKEKLTGTLYIDGVFIKRFPVGIGPGNATPKGTFTIENKLVNPDWFYEGKKYPFGDAKNILGSRWMGMANTASGANGAGLGVHGTAIPESVPGRESKGCVRMHNEDVEELYDFMPQGGKVVIE